MNLPASKLHFLDKPFPKSLSEVARRTGVARGTVYRVMRDNNIEKKKSYTKEELKFLLIALANYDTGRCEDFSMSKKPIGKRDELKVGKETITQRLKDAYSQYEANQLIAEQLQTQVAESDSITSQMVKSINDCMRLKLAQDKNISELESLLEKSGGAEHANDPLA